MAFQKIYYRLLGVVVVLTMAFFSASYFFAHRAGEAQKFPRSLLKAFSAQVAPLITVDESAPLDLEGITELRISSGSIDVEVSALDEGHQGRLILQGQDGRWKTETGSGKYLEIHRDGGRIEVALSRPDRQGVSFNWGDEKDLRFEVRLPKSFAGSLKLQTSSGDVNLVDLHGLKSMELITKSGDVSLSGSLPSEMKVTVTSGDIQARIEAPERLDIDLTSGDIEIELQKISPSARLQLRSVSGDIDVRVPPQAALEVDLQAVSGEVESLLPGLQKGEGAARNIRGRTGVGEMAYLSARAVSGDVILQPKGTP